LQENTKVDLLKNEQGTHYPNSKSKKVLVAFKQLLNGKVPRGDGNPAKFNVAL